MQATHVLKRASIHSVISVSSVARISASSVAIKHDRMSVARISASSVAIKHDRMSVARISASSVAIKHDRMMANVKEDNRYIIMITPACPNYAAGSNRRWTPATCSLD